MTPPTITLILSLLNKPLNILRSIRESDGILPFMTICFIFGILISHTVINFDVGLGLREVPVFGAGLILDAGLILIVLITALSCTSALKPREDGKEPGLEAMPSGSVCAIGLCLFFVLLGALDHQLYYKEIAGSDLKTDLQKQGTASPGKEIKLYGKIKNSPKCDNKKCDIEMLILSGSFDGKERRYKDLTLVRVHRNIFKSTKEVPKDFLKVCGIADVFSDIKVADQPATALTKTARSVRNALDSDRENEFLKDGMHLELKVASIKPLTKDKAYFLLKKRIAIEVRTDKDNIRRVEPRAPFDKTIADLRSRIIRSNISHLDPDRAGIALGILLGDTSYLSPGTQYQFRASGLSHIMAVSGQNVVIIAVALLIVLKFFRSRIGCAYWFVIAFVVLYCGMTLAKPSIMRASLMFIVLTLFYLFNRDIHVRKAFYLVLLIMLMVDPFNIFNLGTLLSFAATGGLIFIYSALTESHAPASETTIDDSLPQQQSTMMNDEALITRSGTSVGTSASVGTNLSAGTSSVIHTGINASGRSKTIIALAVTISAQIATFPITGYFFGELSLYAAIANLFAAFPVTVILLTEVVLMPTIFLPEVIRDGLWSIASPVIGVGSDALLFLIREVSYLPYALLSFYDIRVLVVVGSLIGAALSTIFILRSGRDVLTAVVAVYLSAMLIILTGHFTYDVWDRNTRVTVFDVGEGDSTLIRTGSGRIILIDGGPDSDDVIKRLVKMNINRIDLIVLTHPHLDHISGINGVMRVLPVDAVLEANYSFGSQEYTEFKELIHEKRIKKIVAQRGMVIRFGRDELKVMNPPSKRYSGTSNDFLNNNVSLVFQRDSFRMFFGGDILREGADRVASETDIGPTTAALVPHHGSKYSHSTSIFQEMKPIIYIISVGTNYYGHPTDEVLDFVKKAEGVLYRTDEKGDITLETDGSKLTSSLKGRQVYDLAKTR